MNKPHPDWLDTLSDLSNRERLLVMAAVLGLVLLAHAAGWAARCWWRHRQFRAEVRGWVRFAKLLDGQPWQAKPGDLRESDSPIDQYTKRPGHPDWSPRREGGSL